MNYIYSDYVAYPVEMKKNSVAALR